MILNKTFTSSNKRRSDCSFDSSEERRKYNATASRHLKQINAVIGFRMNDARLSKIDRFLFLFFYDCDSQETFRVYKNHKRRDGDAFFTFFTPRVFHCRLRTRRTPNIVTLLRRSKRFNSDRTRSRVFPKIRNGLPRALWSVRLSDHPNGRVRVITIIDRH